MKLYLTGKVDNGSLQITQKNKYYREILRGADYNNKSVSIVIEPLTSNRSDEQNRLYWGRYVASFAKEWSVSLEQAHEVLKREFNPTYIIIKDKKYKVGGSTSKISVSKFGEYIARLELYAIENQIPLLDL